jgi:hypothetical protein
MGIAVGLLVVGVCMCAGGYRATRSADRTTEVPQAARWLGQRSSLEEWQDNNRRVGNLMKFLGAACLVVSVGVFLVALF